jgi:hypothetical protein
MLFIKRRTLRQPVYVGGYLGNDPSSISRVVTKVVKEGYREMMRKF